jgi:hypothetical protein
MTFLIRPGSNIPMETSFPWSALAGIVGNKPEFTPQSSSDFSNHGVQPPVFMVQGRDNQHLMFWMVPGVQNVVTPPRLFIS